MLAHFRTGCDEEALLEAVLAVETKCGNLLFQFPYVVSRIRAILLSTCILRQFQTDEQQTNKEMTSKTTRCICEAGLRECDSRCIPNPICLCVHLLGNQSNRQTNMIYIYIYTYIYIYRMLGGQTNWETVSFRVVPCVRAVCLSSEIGVKKAF